MASNPLPVGEEEETVEGLRGNFPYAGRAEDEVAAYPAKVGARSYFALYNKGEPQNETSRGARAHLLVRFLNFLRLSGPVPVPAG